MKRRCRRAARRRREGLQELALAILVVFAMFATGVPLAIAFGLQMAGH